MRTVKIQHAKTHLSALVADVEHGDEVVIARGSRPVARLVPLAASGRRELGFVRVQVPDSFFEPLPDDELSGWEG